MHCDFEIYQSELIDLHKAIEACEVKNFIPRMTKEEWLKEQIEKRIGMRNYAYDSCNGRCYYCGVKVHYNNEPRRKLVPFEADHFIARNLGGIDELSNIVCACKECNQQKKNKTIEEFRLYKFGKKKKFYFEKKNSKLKRIGGCYAKTQMYR